MGKYLVRQVVYRESDVDEQDLTPLKEAAEALGMTMPGVIRAIERGQLTEFVDSTVSEIARKGRRFVLRAVVEDFRRKKGENRSRGAASDEYVPQAERQLRTTTMQEQG